MIAAEGCFPVVAALLERGSVVTIPFDGSPVSGRPAPLSAVTARLAMATGALVVPAAATRRRHRVGVALAEPLDPLHHGGVDDIHAPLAAAHRRFVLARPEAYRAPRHAPRVAGSHKRLAAARV